MPFRWLTILPALFLCLPSFAQDGCYPLEILQRQIEYAPSFRIFEGWRLARAVAFFNAYPPPSDIPWASAYFFVLDNGNGILLVGMTNSVCTGLGIPKDAVRDVLEFIEGAAV